MGPHFLAFFWKTKCKPAGKKQGMFSEYIEAHISAAVKPKIEFFLIKA